MTITVINNPLYNPGYESKMLVKSQKFFFSNNLLQPKSGQIEKYIGPVSI